MAHATLLRPPMLVSRHSLEGPITPPLGLAYLASTLRRAGHRVSVIDAVGEAPFQVMEQFDGRMLATGLLIPEIVERLPRETDLIGVTCMFSHEWPYVRKAIESLKAARPSVPIVVGGEHITAVPEVTLQSCPAIDYCVLGEGEETLVDLVQCLNTGDPMTEAAGLALRRDGRIVRSAPRGRMRSIDDIPWPAWDLVPIRNYLDHRLSFGVDRGRSMPILATRGCPYQCTFCSGPTMWTTQYLARTPSLLLDEIEQYLRQYDATNIDFYDLTAIIKRGWIIEFCQLIRERGLRFTWQLPSGTRSEAIDEEVSRHLFPAGCRNLSYAPESGAESTLRRIKKVVKLDRMLASMRGAVKQGINVKANIIFGLPEETRAEIWETIRFMVKMAWVGVHDVSISKFSAYPGSELFESLRERGLIGDLSDEYLLSLGSYSDTTQTVSWDERMSSRELERLRLLGLAVFYGAQYLLRPWRLARTLRNVLAHRQESRLDKAVRDYLCRTSRVGPG